MDKSNYIEWMKKMLSGTPAERRFISGQSFWLFALFYFQHYFTYALANFHYDFFQDCEDLVENKIREAMWIAFREAGKSSMAKISIIWQIACKKRRYLNVDSFDRENAERMLYDIASELTTNKTLIADFWTLFSRKKALDEIKQSRITNFVTENGIRIEAHSTSESVRWRIHGNQRPDALYLDDFENNRTKDSEAYTKQVKDHITEAQAGMAPNGYILYLWNYLTEYGNVQWIMDRAKTDDGIRIRNVPIIINEKPAWEAKYALTTLEAKLEEKVSIEDKMTQLWSQVFSYEMMNQPIDDSIAEFKREYIQRATEDELRHMQLNTFIAIDSAVSEKESADFTGITIARVSKENKWYITSYKKKINTAELIEHMFYLYNLYKPQMIGLEQTTFTIAIEPFLNEEKRKRDTFFTVFPLKHNWTKKETRIRGLIPRYESKSIFHVGDCHDLEEEQRVFPRWNKDDTLDSLAYIEQMAFPPSSIESRGYTPISSVPTYKKNMLTGIIEYT